MSDDAKKGVADFSSKLGPAPKKSLFERQKAEAAAKRERELAETAAVYEDFVKSFEEDGDSSSSRTHYSTQRQRPSGFGPPGPGSLGPAGGGPGPGKRHFTSSSNRVSGPGSLGPPPSLNRKRTHDAFSRDRDYGRLSSSRPDTALDAASAFRASDDEDDESADRKEAERAAAKPTVYLTSMPPGTSPAVIKSLIPQNLSVDNVKILPPSGPSTDRRSTSAIVTLSSETAGSDIDAAVSALQGKYLGRGYYLSISRHLSSAAINSGMPVNVGSSTTSSLPFGAKTINVGPPGRLNRAPPPGHHRGGFAPPSSYGPHAGRAGPTTQVEVRPPSDLKQLRLIHKTLENLLNYGPEFEALLMSRPEVQQEEKWAWLWDARSPGGVYYRWKLWDIITNSKSSGRTSRYERPSSVLFEGGATWVAPEKVIRFEYTTQIDEFVSDDDYNSSDEDSDMEDERRRNAADDTMDAERAVRYMNPLQKAKLTHLLARLPTANTRLRRGDVARVTAFAIEHAGEGGEEVVEMLVANVLRPFAYTHANPNHESAHRDLREEGKANETHPGENGASRNTQIDTSAAKLVGLYVISDILSTSATSGVRHAWRYRQLFENAFRSHKVFEHLGRLEKDLGWGRLKAEKWKRSVGTILHLWEGWCVFSQAAQEHFVQSFENPPLTEKELEAEKKKAEAEKTNAGFSNKGKSRWKAVDEENLSGGRFDPNQPPPTQEASATADGLGDSNLDGEPMSDIDGEPLTDSDLEDANIDGEPMEMDIESDEGPEDAHREDSTRGNEAKAAENAPSQSTPRARKARPRAEDMFADSDEDESVQ
ncbi:hypothetical protein VTN49DRAFT_2324 [Thermomyces lanuginosus]|uniref:uncharacterized protein n=1 Tax=Thermomyces lanuginosus TaxID=5541 RepID=UPI0037428841